MATTYNVQVEDSEGNKYCTKPDLLTTEEQLKANTKTGKSVDALVVKELNNKLVSQLPGGIKLIREGSGADTKYYAQLGADAASKKLLGNNIKVKHDVITITSGNPVTISVDGEVFAALTHSSSGHDSICFIKEDGSLYVHQYYAFSGNSIDNLKNGNILIINNQSGTHAFEYLIFYK